MLKRTEKLTPDVRRVQELQSADASNIVTLQATVTQLQATVNGILSVQANVPSSPVANLLWNGDLSHSNYTWFEVSGTPSGDKNDECAFFYSHTAPSTAQNFTAITTANQIPLPGHDFQTGCAIDFFDHGGGETLPTGLAFNTTYFVYALSPTIIQLATTVALAEAGTPDVLITTATGSGTHTIEQILIATTSYVSATNNELKTIAHSTFNPNFSKWDSPNGQGDMTTTTSIDTPLPSNMIDATVNLARVSLVAARLNLYIEIPVADVFTAGIWDNTAGQRKFITGDIGFSASLVGATGTTERRFRAYYQSDRGFTLLSNEVTILNGVPDGSMDDLNYIQMSWLQQAGQLQVSIYEHYDPAGVNQYRLVATVSSATSFIYEGNYLSVVAGYPAATDTARTATFSTQVADMSDLAINAVVPQWDTVNFPILVPNNYNKANTTNRQWLRLWHSIAANIFIPSAVTTNGTTSITIPSGIINTAAFASGGYGSGTSSLYANLLVDIYDEDDVLLANGLTLVSATSDTAIVVSHSIVAGVNRKLRIVGGGFHGILIDKVHLGFQQNTSYAPNANDVRTLQPLSSPTNSDQGGVGIGGSGGGIVTCIAQGQLVKRGDGQWIPVERQGIWWASGQPKPNMLLKLKQGFEQVRRVRSRLGVEVICTDTESFMIDNTDYRGTALHSLRVGDTIFVEIDDRIVKDSIESISAYLGQATVYTPTLSDSHLFIAGKLELKWWQNVWNRVFLGREVKGGFVLHNQKSLPNQSPDQT